jgi:hypothetical protein
VTERTRDTESDGNNAYGEPSSPDPNQQKHEPIGTSAEESAQAGDSSRASKEQGEPARHRTTTTPAGPTR